MRKIKNGNNGGGAQFKKNSMETSPIDRIKRKK
jgi:hypothetical protein